MVEGARSAGIPTFESQNGCMMECKAGASIVELRTGRHTPESVFRSYTFPVHGPTESHGAHARPVRRIIFENNRAIGVEISYDGKVVSSAPDIRDRAVARRDSYAESADAIGDRRSGSSSASTYRWCRIFPASAKTFRITPRLVVSGNTTADCLHAIGMAEATFFWKSGPGSSTPDMQPCQVELTVAEPRERAAMVSYRHSWTLFGGWSPGRRAAARSVSPGANPVDPSDRCECAVRP